eukprot:scaffold1007_cov176-Amphora_coffeaeformis.AAC.11
MKDSPCFSLGEFLRTYNILAVMEPSMKSSTAYRLSDTNQRSSRSSIATTNRQEEIRRIRQRQQEELDRKAREAAERKKQEGAESKAINQQKKPKKKPISKPPPGGGYNPMQPWTASQGGGDLKSA